MVLDKYLNDIVEENERFREALEYINKLGYPKNYFDCILKLGFAMETANRVLGGERMIQDGDRSSISEDPE